MSTRARKTGASFPDFVSLEGIAATIARNNKGDGTLVLFPCANAQRFFGLRAGMCEAIGRTGFSLSGFDVSLARSKPDRLKPVLLSSTLVGIIRNHGVGGGVGGLLLRDLLRLA